MVKIEEHSLIKEKFKKETKTSFKGRKHDKWYKQ